MHADSKLVYIKTLHTLIWIFFNVVIFYIVFAVFTDKINFWLWICYGLIILEGITLAVFKLYCPLTLWAKKYSNSHKANFDIYLPEWLARYNKIIYTSIVGIATIILIIKLLIID